MSACWSGETHWPPTSSIAPSMTSVCTRPPTRSRASRTATDRPACFRAFAAVRPAAPAPTITTSLVNSLIVLLHFLVLRVRFCAAWAARMSGGGDERRRRGRRGLPGEGLGDDVEPFVEQLVREGQRREEADDVAVG